MSTSGCHKDAEEQEKSEEKSYKDSEELEREIL